MSNDWTHIGPLVLSNVCNALGYRNNVVNKVCKTWKGAKKVYTDIVIQKYEEWDTFIKNIDIRLVRNLFIAKYDSANNHKIFSEFKSLKKIVFCGFNGCKIGDEIITILQEITELEEIDFGFMLGTSINALIKSKVRKIKVAKCEGNTLELLCAKNIEKLTLHNCESITIDNVKALDNVNVNINVKLKDVSFWYLPNDVVDKLLEILSRASFVEQLDIGFSKINDNGMYYLCKMTQLTTLDLGHCRGISCEGLKMLGQLVNLRELSVEKNDGVTDEVIGEFRKIERLNVLDISRCFRVTDEGLKILGELKELWDLSLEGICINDKGLNVLPLSLKVLRLTRCMNITDEGVGNLSRLIFLEELFLRTTCVSDEGMRALIREGSAIRVLDLYNCKITEESLMYLGELKSLRKLYVDERYDIRINHMNLFEGRVIVVS